MQISEIYFKIEPKIEYISSKSKNFYTAKHLNQ